MALCEKSKSLQSNSQTDLAVFSKGTWLDHEIQGYVPVAVGARLKAMGASCWLTDKYISMTLPYSFTMKGFVG